MADSPPPGIAEANALDRAGFVARFGGIFEHSPRIAERAWMARPFRDVAHLHAAMVEAMRAATDVAKSTLLRAHPELAGREARENRLTAESKGEQGSAGLERLPPAEFRRLAAMNAAYRAKHGFPFIIAVRARTKDEILAEFARRLERDPAAERESALAEVETIARIRLDRMMGAAAI